MLTFLTPITPMHHDVTSVELSFFLLYIHVLETQVCNPCRMVFCYRTLIDSVTELYKQKDFVILCQHWRQRNIPPPMQSFLARTCKVLASPCNFLAKLNLQEFFCKIMVLSPLILHDYCTLARLIPSCKNYRLLAIILTLQSCKSDLT